MSARRYALLVTGASSDIGTAVIRALDDGESLFLVHYHAGEEKIAQLQSDVRSETVPIRADLGTPGGVDSLIATVKRHTECPDGILHLAAPRLDYVRFRDVTWNKFQMDLDVGLRSAVLILKEFLPLMAKRKSGKVVFALSSNCVGVPPKALAHYTTAKFALLGLMRSLAAEYADRYVAINAVSPSMVETAFLSGIPSQIVEMAAAAHPLKRNATPEDVVPALKFLLSATGFITGVNLPVTGGAVF